MGKGNQEVQTSRYKLNKSWGNIIYTMKSTVNKTVLTLQGDRR